MAGTSEALVVTAETATRVADVLRRAGEIVRRIYTAGPQVRTKPDGSFVTDAEDAIEAFLRRELTRLVPDAAWLSEESVSAPSRVGARCAWIVDPLDGTREFVNRIPEFAISVGLVEDGRCVLGAVLNPATGEGGVGVVGGFLRFWGVPPARTPVISLEAATVSVSRSEASDGSIAPYRDLAGATTARGSVAYKLLRVAAGVDHLTMSVQPKSEWDVCGGVALLAATGRIYRRLDGAPLRFNQPDTRIRSGGIAGPCHLVNELVVRVAQRQMALSLVGDRIGRAVRDMNTYLLEPSVSGFNLVRHGRGVVAVAQLLGPVDVAHATGEQIAGWKEQGCWLEDLSLDRLKARVEAAGDPAPSLIEADVDGFNIVRFGGRYYGVAQSVGAVYLPSLSAAAIADLMTRRQCCVASTLEDVRRAIAAIEYWPGPTLIEPGYRGFNLVGYHHQVHAAAEELGAVDVTSVSPEAIARYAAAGLWITAPDLATLKTLVDARSFWPVPELFESGYRGFNLVGCRHRVHAVGEELGAVSIASLPLEAIEALVAAGVWVTAPSLAAARAIVDTRPFWPAVELIEARYRGFNLVGYQHQVHGVAERLGPIDVPLTPLSAIERYMADGAWVTAPTLAAAKSAIDVVRDQSSDRARRTA